MILGIFCIVCGLILTVWSALEIVKLYRRRETFGIYAIPLTISIMIVGAGVLDVMGAITLN